MSAKVDRPRAIPLLMGWNVGARMGTAMGWRSGAPRLALPRARYLVLSGRMPTSRPLRSKLVATLGIAFITYLLGNAIVRLTPLALAPWRDGSLSTFQKLLWIGWFAGNAYFEGYKGFQQRFSPRVVGRAAYLGDHPTALRIVLAPFFVLSMFHAKRSQLIFRWCFLIALYALIYAVSFVPQPWRGIIDGGVVVGLLWGLLAVWYYFALYLMDREHPVASDFPESEPLPPALAPAE